MAALGSVDALRLVDIFKGITEPEVYINESDRICIPVTFTIQVDRNKDRIYAYLQFTHLKRASKKFQEAFLDILYLLLRTDIYGVIRFRCSMQAEQDVHNLNKSLLTLLQDCILWKAPLSITKRVIHLVGLVGKAGFSATDLKAYLDLLKAPSELTISLLQALKLMFREDASIAKVGSPNPSPPLSFTMSLYL